MVAATTSLVPTSSTGIGRRRNGARCLARVMLVTGAVAAAGCGPGENRPQSPSSTVLGAQTADALRSESEVRETDIAFYKERVERDPTGATDLAQLASLYLQRSRETGDPNDAIRAEKASRLSLHNRTSRNNKAAQILASSLLSQHRFADALVVARALSARNPDLPTLRAAVGEIEMELGDYDAARESFRSVAGEVNDLSVLPRLARWAEIEGKPEEGEQLLRLSLARALRQRRLPREQLAWFWLRLGDVELRSGRVDAAESAYKSGLATHPGDYRILAALAHLSAVRHRWKQAVSYGQDAIASSLDPATLGTLSDSYSAIGDTAAGAEYARALDAAVLKQPGAYHRAWSLFLLDHDRHVATVTRKVRAELQTRRDIYGYDLLAWALYKQHRGVDAEHAMAKALREGTVDALLFYHAGMIERSLGNTAAARAQLTRALAVNPYFQTAAPDSARAALATLTPVSRERVVASARSERC